MRTTFIKSLFDLAAVDERIVLLTGDLGFSVMEPFAAAYPNRFYNVGVAEQNMVGVATGLAGSGFIPFCYSIATFASMRPYEFLRSGAILHQWPVRVIGVGGGFEYGTAGPTHYGLEDVGIMRVQPGLTLVAPADAAQTRTALNKTWDLPGPVYYRLGKNDNVIVAGLNGRFDLGKVQIVREGKDALFVTMGGVSNEVVAAAEKLEQHGLKVAVAVVASLNPAPIEDLVKLLNAHPVALTVEAHYVNGGVGSLISEVVAEHGLRTRIVRCAIKETPGSIVGGEKFMNAAHGLDAASLIDAMRLQLQGALL